MKMNSLVDRRCIRALYRASQAGVPGRPQHPRHLLPRARASTGVSENIRVVSVVGRFLEHSRIFAFERDGETRVYIGSADLMPRNLDTRVELVDAGRRPALREDLLDTLERSLADETNAWELSPDDVDAPHAERARAPQVQRELMLGHPARAAEDHADRLRTHRAPTALRRRVSLQQAFPFASFFALAVALAVLAGSAGLQQQHRERRLEGRRRARVRSRAARCSSAPS